MSCVPRNDDRFSARKLLWRRRGLLLLLTVWVGAVSLADDEQLPDRPPFPGADQPAPAKESWLLHWLDPKNAPFIPVPEIATDPNAGLTVGLLPVFLKTDDSDHISEIIAPDVFYTPDFGIGTHGRIYSYESGDTQWSVVAGIKQRVEREFDAEYQSGREREQRWTLGYSLIFDRSGVPRFYGIGNGSVEGDQTNFTDSQEVAQVNVGLNLNHEWQLLYSGRFQDVAVLPGTLEGVPSIQTKFPKLDGLGTDRLQLNRLSLIYDTRNDLTIATQGMQLIAYGGMSGANGLLNDSTYTEAGFDGRVYWPILAETTLALHTSMRYLPYAHDVPFWALSNLGGGESDVGGAQALRGFGAGRFYARDSFATTAEWRRKVMTFNAGASSVDVEIAPFIDIGRVFSHSATLPFDDLHKVGGVGFRGIAKPFVVGHVDLGYGSEGLAVFTGLNYPF